MRLLFFSFVSVIRFSFWGKFLIIFHLFALWCFLLCILSTFISILFNICCANKCTFMKRKASVQIRVILLWMCATKINENVSCVRICVPSSNRMYASSYEFLWSNEEHSHFIIRFSVSSYATYLSSECSRKERFKWQNKWNCFHDLIFYCSLPSFHFRFCVSMMFVKICYFLCTVYALQKKKRKGKTAIYSKYSRNRWFFILLSAAFVAILNHIVY